MDLGTSNEYFCKVEVTPVIINTGSDCRKAEIAAAEAIYPDCQTSEKPIMAGN